MRILVLTAAIALASAGIAFAQEDEIQVDCANPQSTPEINQCLAGDLDTADAELNTAYKKAMTSQVELDKMLAESNIGAVGAAKALKAAQRAWIDFRDTNCASITYQNAGGTGQTAEYLSCQIRMTTERTKELREITGEEN